MGLGEILIYWPTPEGRLKRRQGATCSEQLGAAD